ncbi:TB2/DP1/HVA22-related protein [Trinorchestia longiramus]|nr:TB2/DP1/HVA22-related protein [Trinorchestia longiramus]
MAENIHADGHTKSDEAVAAVTAPNTPPTSEGDSQRASVTTSTPAAEPKTHLSRKRSFKRPAPPPPQFQSSSSRPSTPFVALDARSDVPEVPLRSQSSVEATKKLQNKYSPSDNAGVMPSQAPVPDRPTDSSDYEFIDRANVSNYYPYVNYPSYPLPPRSTAPPYSPYGAVYYPPPGWDDRRGLIHSASEGSVVPYRRPSTSGPLVPVLEEPLDVPTPPDTSASTPPLSPSSPVSASPTRRRLERSDSLITVAHLYEDLYVVTPFIRLTLTNLTCVVVVAALALPNTASLLYTFFRLVFGTLFPAYYSYKAVKTKNVKEYVKWMMYWIVFAFFTCFETITDLFLAFWFPFYYELKILLVLWLLSPATRGSSVLYRRFVHPWLTQREDEIDDCIARAKEQGYSTVLQLGTKGVNYATTVIMQTAIKGGGGLVNQLKRSYSVGELGDPDDPMNSGDLNRNIKALPATDVTDYGHHRHHNTGTSQQGTQRNIGTTEPGSRLHDGTAGSGSQPQTGAPDSLDQNETHNLSSDISSVSSSSPNTLPLFYEEQSSFEDPDFVPGSKAGVQLLKPRMTTRSMATRVGSKRTRLFF